MNRFAIIFGALTFVSTLAGGLFAVRFRKRFGILAAFAAGVLIAVSLFDLLPEALRLAAKAGVPLEQVMYVTAIGFIFLLILERYFSVHRICLPDGTCSNVHHHQGGFFGC
jgi:zinc transporter ZupT